MNKQEIGILKKQFKKDNYNLQIGTIYHFLIKKGGDVSYIDSIQFSRISDEEEQKILLNNFKKVLAEELDVKSFQISLKDDKSKQQLKGLKQSFDQEHLKELVEKIANKCNYPKDVDVTLVSGTYNDIPRMPKKRGRKSKAEKEMEEQAVAEGTEISYNYSFILATINLITPAKKCLNLDYKEQAIVGTNSTTRTINFSVPVEGFIYPLYTNQTEDSNGLLYYTKKKGEPNATFIYDILGGEICMTQKEQTGYFNTLLSELYEDQPISLEAISGIYDELNEMKQDYAGQEDNQEPLTVSPGELRHIFERNKVPNTSKILEFCEVHMSNQQFKVESILPGMVSKLVGESWSLNIENVHLRDKLSIEKDEKGGPYLKLAIRSNPMLDGLSIK